VKRLADGRCQPRGLIATTFTAKAAHELRERLPPGASTRRASRALAEGLDQSLIGTVHSVCGQLLGRFAFEAGIPPRLEVLEEKQAEVLLKSRRRSRRGSRKHPSGAVACDRLGQIDHKTSAYRWNTRCMTSSAKRARTTSMLRLWTLWRRPAPDGLLNFLPPPSPDDLDAALSAAITSVLGLLAKSGDDTRKTADYVALLQQSLPVP